MGVHGDNLSGKLVHQTKYTDELSRQYLREIQVEYEKWVLNNKNLKGPYSDSNEKKVTSIIEQRVRLQPGWYLHHPRGRDRSVGCL